MFRKLHIAYTNVMSNPFYRPGDCIRSKKFDSVVHSILGVKEWKFDLADSVSEQKRFLAFSVCWYGTSDVVSFPDPDFSLNAVPDLD